MPKKKPVKRKIDSKKKQTLDKMSKEFAPESGFKFSKFVTKKNKEYFVSYQLKGDSVILNYIEQNLYNAISMAFENIQFQAIPISNNNSYITVILNTMRNPNLNTDFAMFVTQFPIIDINKGLDNLLEIKIAFSETNIGLTDIDIIIAIEYILSAISENINEIKEIAYDCIKIVSSDDVINIDDINDDIFNPYVFIKKEDLNKMMEENKDAKVD